jgi:hypothetical protein
MGPITWREAVQGVLDAQESGARDMRFRMYREGKSKVYHLPASCDGVLRG